jgi:hypothetical protein
MNRYPDSSITRLQVQGFGYSSLPTQKRLSLLRNCIVAVLPMGSMSALQSKKPRANVAGLFPGISPSLTIS